MSADSPSRPADRLDVMQVATDVLLVGAGAGIFLVGYLSRGLLVTPDWTDIGVEVLLALAIFVGYLFVRLLGVGYLSLGWAFITLSQILDVVDEFGIPPLWDGFIETGLKLTGFPLVAVGLFYSVRRAQEQLRATEEAQRDVQASEDRFRGLFEEAPVGYYEADREGFIRRANQAAHSLLGRAPESLVDWRVADLAWESADGERRSETRMPPTSGAPGRTRAVTYRHPDGTPRHLELHESPILDADGRSRGVRTAILDTTARRAAEREREELQSRMQQNQRLETIGTLAGGIAHDFNNLLAPILGYVEMARAEVSRGSQVHEDLGQVQTAATRAKDLVRQILQFSRPENDEAHPILLQGVVREAAELLRASLPTTIDLVRRVDAMCPPVMAKGTQIHQVLFNLCTNASHAMPEGGKITISLDIVDAVAMASHPESPSGRHVRLRVSDTGSGMPEEVAQRVFEPFFTTKRAGAGTGLGLSVVHGIITSFDGTISVQSELGSGTTFTVLFPALEADLVEIDTSTETAEVAVEGHVLLVDDQDEVLAVMTRVLSRLGFRVTCYANSTDAAQAFRDSPSEFDLVVTDQTMPGLTGLELARQIRQISDRTPVLLTTGYSNSVSPESLEQIGGCALLMKPATAAQISEVSARLLSAVPAPST